MQDDQPAAKQQTPHGMASRKRGPFHSVAVVAAAKTRQDMKMTLGYGHRQRKIIEVACFAHKHTHSLSTHAKVQVNRENS